MKLHFTRVALLLAGAFVAAAPAVAADRLARADKAFMVKAAESGRSEIEAGKLAEGRAVDADVKAYAAKMVADHTRLGEQLGQLAAAKGVKLRDTPTLVQKASLKSLSGLQGEKFDFYYANDMGMKAHENTFVLFKNAADGARDADVKAFATQALPVLKQHLDMAYTLKRSTAPGAPASPVAR